MKFLHGICKYLKIRFYDDCKSQFNMFTFFHHFFSTYFPVVCAIRVLGLTLSNAMPVAFGCTNAVQT